MWTASSTPCPIDTMAMEASVTVVAIADLVAAVRRA